MTCVPALAGAVYFPVVSIVPFALDPPFVPSTYQSTAVGLFALTRLVTVSVN